MCSCYEGDTSKLPVTTFHRVDDWSHSNTRACPPCSTHCLVIGPREILTPNLDPIATRQIVGVSGMTQFPGKA